MIVMHVTKFADGRMVGLRTRGDIRATKGYEMANQGRATVSESAQDRSVNVIEAAGLVAEYSTGCTPTGEWFALGTIVREAGARAMPAWVVVGTGTSVEEAVQGLAAEIETQARSLSPA